jgi:hypothetical protein
LKERTKTMAKDSLAQGAPKASYGPVRVSQEKWEEIFGPTPSFKKQLPKPK